MLSDGSLKWVRPFGSSTPHSLLVTRMLISRTFLMKTSLTWIGKHYGRGGQTFLAAGQIWILLFLSGPTIANYWVLSFNFCKTDNFCQAFFLNYFILDTYREEIWLTTKGPTGHKNIVKGRIWQCLHYGIKTYPYIDYRLNNCWFWKSMTHLKQNIDTSLRHNLRWVWEHQSQTIVDMCQCGYRF